MKLHKLRPVFLLICVIVTGPLLRADDSADGEAEVGLRDAAWKDVKKYVASQKGKVVVLDLWSTGCPPCMREFPNLVKLHQKHKDKIVCVSLNVDYAGIKKRPPSYFRPAVEKFLKSKQATIRNYMSTTESDEVLEAVDVFSIPAVFVYGRDGKLALIDKTLREPPIPPRKLNPDLPKSFEKVVLKLLEKEQDRR